MRSKPPTCRPRRAPAARRRRVGAALAALAVAAFAGAQPLAGSYQGTSDAGPTTAVLEQQGDRLVGRVEAPGVRFELEGAVQGDVGYGWVATGQGTAGFEAHVRGDALGLYLFEVDAAGAAVPGTVIELLLERVAASAPAPALGALRAAPAAARVLARGAHAELSEDAAHAFLEALEFVFGEIGLAYTFPPAERQAAVAAIASAFPQASREEQLVLADARAVWTRVRANWPQASLDDRREFALGVLALAYGEEAVAAWVGGAAAAPAGGDAGGACATFEDCAGAYVDGGTWSDTFNTQSCWAAAGCAGYDTSTGTFDYRD